jgi:CHRD domain-containing protein
MKHPRVKFLFASIAVITLAATLSYSARADNDGAVTLRARLTGFEEVPPRLTTGHGTFTAKLSPDGNSITFTETWTGLVGNTVSGGHVLFSHIHFGQRGVAAGIVVFLCGPTGPSNPDKPACQDSSSGSATGIITAADVFPTGALSSATDQGVKQGDLAGLLRIIRSGNAYVNIHTTEFAAGEIRGQIQVSRDEDEEDR